jgi:hypothetical protein
MEYAVRSDAFVSWSVRMPFSGNLSGGVAEAAFCYAAVEIRQCDTRGDPGFRRRYFQ